MRIAYLGQMADVANENGISKKIRSQARSWTEAGHDVRYFSLVPSTVIWPEFAVDCELVARGNAVLRGPRSLVLANRVRSWAPDVIYYRYAYHSAGFARLFRDITTLAEINSDDRTEYPLTLSPLKQLYHRATRGRILRRVAAFVAVTHELAARFSAYGRPHEVIGNSVDLRETAPVAEPPPAGPARLIFVGSAGSPWHGIERVIELANLFPEVGFDIVGMSAQSAPANTRFHGSLPRTKYEPLLQHATAAIGTFALYRKGMDEACPLKVREYLASGLPVIAAYHDTDIPETSEYFLRLPNNDEALAPHRERIESWLNSWRNRRVARPQIQHLDTTVKETQRLTFIRRIADAARKP